MPRGVPIRGDKEVFVGARVRTTKGAAFRGVVVSQYTGLINERLHVVVEATDEAFRGTQHVYPMAQVEREP